MTLQQLTYFLAAAEHGSFSAAADTLHMAQPSLSEQVRRLESELGVALFVRAGRRLELTQAGRVLLPHAERTLQAAEETMSSVRDVRTMATWVDDVVPAPGRLLAELYRQFGPGRNRLMARTATVGT